MVYFVLPKREYETIQLASQGLTGKEIAHKIFITEKTVQSYLRSAYKKLGISNKRQLPEFLRRSRIRVKISISDFKD